MTNIGRVLVCAFLGLTVVIVVSATQTTSTAPAVASFADRYPGRNVHTGSCLDVGKIAIYQGVENFHAVFGHWPTSWHEVVASGIWQTPVLGPQMQPINPDDGKLDFPLDIIFDGKNDPPKIYSLDLHHNRIAANPLFPKEPYSKFLSSKFFRDRGYDTSKWQSDPTRLRQFGILAGVYSSMITFYELNGRYPASFDEYLDSGLGPIDFHSVNPMTNQRFYGDGRANDVYYKEFSAKHTFVLQHVEADGKVAPIKFTY